MNRLVNGLIVNTLLLAAVAYAASPAAGQDVVEPTRPGQEAFLSRAVFADGRLWLLSDAGVVSSVVEGAEARVEMTFSKPALELCLVGGKPAVVTGDAEVLPARPPKKPSKVTKTGKKVAPETGASNEPGPAWTVHTWTGGAWSATASVPTEGDALVGVCSSGGALVMLTDRRLVELTGGESKAVALHGEPTARGTATLHGTPEALFVGLNGGEWGGGLRRIDRSTGQVTLIEHTGKGGLCDGLLDARCDPVTGIATLPWKPGCLAVSVGLLHFRSSGRLVDVCGDEVSRLHVKPFGEQWPNLRGPPDDEPNPSVAFFGLISRGGSLWAAGIDGLYRLEEGGVVTSVPMPSFRTIDGIDVSFELPDVVLVLTDINTRRSVSGSVPMLVPR